MKIKLVLTIATTITILIGVILDFSNMETYRQQLSLIAINSVMAVPDIPSEIKWTDSFMLSECDFSPIGNNTYFILKPGYQLVYAGIDEGTNVKLTTTVLNETKVINGIETRIVEERATNNDTGELFELSRNYFAICDQTNSVFYFGEDVDWYKDGKIVNHTGAWKHGINNAKAGLIMPGIVLLGARYHQETAPNVEIDRAELISINETVNTPIGKFENCLQVKETDALQPSEEGAYKYYAPKIGQVKDEMLNLISYGYIK